jgi:hypothetical protein
MPPTTYTPLCASHVYELGSQLLEACWLDDASTWRLYLLDERGEYVNETQGLLMAYELRTDGSGAWDRLHYAQIAAIWPAWCFLRGGTVQIDYAALNFVAESREALLTTAADEDEQFETLMAEFSWNLEE